MEQANAVHDVQRWLHLRVLPCMFRLRIGADTARADRKLGPEVVQIPRLADDFTGRLISWETLRRHMSLVWSLVGGGGSESNQW